MTKINDETSGGTKGGSSRRSAGTNPGTLGRRPPEPPFFREVMEFNVLPVSSFLAK